MRYIQLIFLLFLVNCQVDDNQRNDSISDSTDNSISQYSAEGDSTGYTDTFTVRRPTPLTKAEREEHDSLLKEMASLSTVITRGNADQEKAAPALYSEIITTDPDIAASFPGGDAGMQAYIRRHLFYPPIAYQNNTKGIVMVRFIVETDGSVTNVSVTKRLDEACDHSAKRVVENMPFWTPARKDGLAVRTQHTIPIRFDSNN
jgi:TonB family protein